MTTERPPIPPEHLREINGRVMGNRHALAHLIDRSVSSVTNTLARHDSQFPQPAYVDGRKHWYDLAYLKAYAEIVIARRQAERRPATEPGGAAPDADDDADLDELLGVEPAAVELGIDPDVLLRYATESQEAWDRGEPGLLPVPDQTDRDEAEAVRHRWKRGTLRAFRPQLMLEPLAAAAERGIGLTTLHGYIWKSRPFWERDEDAPLLPRPDQQFKQGKQTVYRWRRDTLQRHKAASPGKGVGGGRGRTRGTPAGEPTADPDQLIGPAAAAVELGIGYDTFRQRVRESEPLWDQDRLAPIPAPDEQGRRGQHTTYRWRRSTLATAPQS